MPSVYSFTTPTRATADSLSRFLRLNGVPYERSGCYGSFYFSITATPEEVERIDNYLDTLYIVCAQPLTPPTKGGFFV